MSADVLERKHFLYLRSFAFDRFLKTPPIVPIIMGGCFVHLAHALHRLISVQTRIKGGDIDSLLPLYFIMMGFALALTWALVWKRHPIDQLIVDKIKTFGSLTAIGDPGTKIGSKLVSTTDENWKETARALMRDANIILFAPSDSGGTLWEIDAVFQSGYLPKTIFIMPGRSFIGFRTGRFQMNWKNLSRHVSEMHEIDFPTYRDKGRVFLY